MKQLLFVAYYFPPDGGGGTQRPAKFCKYLPQFGWRTTVLTRQLTQGRTKWDPLDHSLENAASDQLNVVRVQSPGDAIDGWVVNAEQRIRTGGFGGGRFDAALITMPPYAAASLIDALRESLHCPVVLDLRDPWAFDGAFLHRSRGTWKATLGRMKRFCRLADHVIANTPESKRLVTTLGCPESKVTVIPNGFDRDDFPAVDPCRRGDSPADIEGPFDLVHSGTFRTSDLYHNRSMLGSLKRLINFRAEPIEQSGRTPLHLLAAVKRLRASRPDLYDRLRIVMLGPADDATRRCVSESGVEDRVKMTGYLPHDQSVTRLRAAAALFLPLFGLPAGHRSRIIPGKVYEYLAAEKPILAALPDGDALDLVKRHGVSVQANPTDASSIESAIVDLMEGRYAKQPGDRQGLQSYERRALTERLGGTLSAIVEQFSHSVIKR